MNNLENKYGISCSVINMHTIKPIDVESIYDANRKHKLLVTAEEHSVYGGLFSAVSEELSQFGIHKPVLAFGIKDFFAHAGSYDFQMRDSGLTVDIMREKIIEKLEKM